MGWVVEMNVGLCIHLAISCPGHLMEGYLATNEKIMSSNLCWGAKESVACKILKSLACGTVDEQAFHALVV